MHGNKKRRRLTCRRQFSAAYIKSATVPSAKTKQECNNGPLTTQSPNPEHPTQSSQPGLSQAPLRTHRVGPKVKQDGARVYWRTQQFRLHDRFTKRCHGQPHEGRAICTCNSCGCWSAARCLQLQRVPMLTSESSSACDTPRIKISMRFFGEISQKWSQQESFVRYDIDVLRA